jgi:hypothetical protein
MKMKRAMKTGAEAQMHSYRDQRQFFAGTANPLRSGPKDADLGFSIQSILSEWKGQTHVHMT